MAYIPFPLPEMIKEWTAQGGKVSDLIEPVDGTKYVPSLNSNAQNSKNIKGFHPSQIGNYVLVLLASFQPVIN